MPPSTPRTSHRHSDSSPAIVFPRPQEDQRPANRIMSSVRRTLSTAKRRDPVAASASIYSTPAERNPYSPSRFRYESSAAARPTVEQIAMGLHLSRTPHLRAPPRHLSTPIQPARPPVPLPPPPARSSLKNPNPKANALSKTVLVPPPSALLHGGGSTSSTTDVTSTAPSTPHSSDRSSLSLRARMSRFLPHRNTAASPPFVASTVSSPRTSTSEVNFPRKKAVRFSAIVQEEDD